MAPLREAMSARVPQWAARVMPVTPAAQPHANTAQFLIIPRKSNEKAKPVHFAKALYKGRARIEQAIGKLKRIALSCEKTKRNFFSFIALAARIHLGQIRSRGLKYRIVVVALS